MTNLKIIDTLSGENLMVCTESMDKSLSTRNGIYLSIIIIVQKCSV